MTSESTSGSSSLPGSLPEMVGRRAPIGTAFSWVILAAFLWWVSRLFTQNEHLELSIVRDYLFNANIIHGLLNTLLLAVCAQLVALVLGLVVGFGRLSRQPAFATGAWLYVWLFRSTPLVVQILLWGNLALFLPQLGVGGWSVETNAVLTPFVAGVIALSLHDTAYVAEIVRSGVISVPSGQREAGAALGLSRWQIERKVVLPQALRVMIPQFGSFFVLLLKSTSLVVVIAGGDLLTEAQNISSVNLRTIELLLVATIWFLTVTSIAAAGQWFLERRFDRQNREESDRAAARRTRTGK